MATPGLVLRVNGAGTAQEFVSVTNAGIKVMRKFQYDFSIDGGAQGTIPLRAIDGLGDLPDKFIVQGVEVDMITALTSGGAALAALTTGQGAGDMVAATVVAGAPFSTTGLKVTSVLASTVATHVKTTAARAPAIVVTGADLNGGKLNAFIEGVVSD